MMHSLGWTYQQLMATPRTIREHFQLVVKVQNEKQLEDAAFQQSHARARSGR